MSNKGRVNDSAIAAFPINNLGVYNTNAAVVIIAINKPRVLLIRSKNNILPRIFNRMYGNLREKESFSGEKKRLILAGY